MPYDEAQLRMLNADYQRVTGAVPKKFVCPITLRDETGAELCNGHILNHGLKNASRAAVVQRKDVDNFYGHSIEPDTVKWLNLSVSTTEQILRMTRNATLTTPDGEKVPIFWASNSACQKFQHIDLFRPDGSSFRGPFLRKGAIKPGRFENVEIEHQMTFSAAAITGSLLKSAYLAAFMMFGYAFVFSHPGRRIREALAGFFSQHGKGAGGHHFFDFRGCHAILECADQKQGEQDTLSDKLFLFHYAEASREDTSLFAVTYLFRINGRVIAVTLPAHFSDPYFMWAYGYYGRFLRDRSIAQSVHRGQFASGAFQLDPTPLRLSINREGDVNETGVGIT